MLLRIVYILNIFSSATSFLAKILFQELGAERLTWGWGEWGMERHPLAPLPLREASFEKHRGKGSRNLCLL